MIYKRDIFSFIVYSECPFIIKKAKWWCQMKSNGTTSLWQNRFGLNFTLENICPLSQVPRHSFLKSNTVSLFRLQFPLKSRLEFRWNNSFWICTWYLPFFSETAHFLPEIAAHGQNSLHPLKLLISPKTMSARKTFLCCAGCIAGHK